MKFKVLDRETAPAESRPIMDAVAEKYGFLPNLVSVLSHSPAAAEAYTSIGKALEKAALDPVEQQVVFLTVSVRNGCDYCVAAHSTLAKGTSMSDEVLEALRNGDEIPDPKLRALARFAAALREHQGWVPDEELAAFAEAGYEQRHVLDVITILAMKTLSNYTNHIVGTPLDDAFADQAWDGARNAA
ncbi:MAG: carboxymuconolactone decarboxylase family protein [Woeseiaceae bacterium]|nr:carboxymuconolactone decarboxylase family protein [Woeseiaceae bacterium]